MAKNRTFSCGTDKRNPERARKAHSARSGTQSEHRIRFILLARRFSHIIKAKKNPPPVGLEPTTFELEVQHASPLRHGGCCGGDKEYYSPVPNYGETHLFPG